jgi:hypothetical protein
MSTWRERLPASGVIRVVVVVMATARAEALPGTQVIPVWTRPEEIIPILQVIVGGVEGVETDMIRPKEMRRRKAKSQERMTRMVQQRRYRRLKLDFRFANLLSYNCECIIRSLTKHRFFFSPKLF